MRISARRFVTLSVLGLMFILSTISISAQEDVTLRYFMWDPSFEETEQIMVDTCAAELGIIDIQKKN